VWERMGREEEEEVARVGVGMGGEGAETRLGLDRD
jgi:hypothetical protein